MAYEELIVPSVGDYPYQKVNGVVTMIAVSLTIALKNHQLPIRNQFVLIVTRRQVIPCALLFINEFVPMLKDVKYAQDN